MQFYEGGIERNLLNATELNVCVRKVSRESGEGRKLSHVIAKSSLMWGFMALHGTDNATQADA